MQGVAIAESTLRAGYVALFGLAAVGCLFAAVRARDIAHAGTRHGLLGLLATSAGWAGAQALHLLVSARSLAVGLHVVGLVCGFGTVFAWLYFCSAYTGESYHRNRRYRGAAAALFLSVTVLKVTNPIHGMYFALAMESTPFQHLVVRQLPLYWATTVLAYALSAVGLYMLFRLLSTSNVPTTGLGALISLTVLPVVFDVLGDLPVWWVPNLNYEPVGVAAFAVGALYLTEGTFEQVRWSGHRQVLDSLSEAVVVVDDDDVVRDANATARRLFPGLPEGVGRSLADALPDVAAHLEAGEDVMALDREGETRYYLLNATALTLGPTGSGERWWERT